MLISLSEKGLDFLRLSSQNHYSEPLQIEDIARYIGLNRSYLSTLFKEHTGQSPLKYLQTFRLTKVFVCLGETGKKEIEHCHLTILVIRAGIVVL